MLQYRVRYVFFVQCRRMHEVAVWDPKKGGKKKYIVPMFPYPSGNLHMGHVRVYTISDCLGRYASLRGDRVTHPIGWDAFGLPAENAAMERGMDPESWTQKSEAPLSKEEWQLIMRAPFRNTETMRKQLLQLGCNFDWDREVSTCDPNYYRWTQWLFIKLYEAGLVKQRRSFVNWDPVDGTVLANEQIDSEGRSWRSGAPAEWKLLRQWFVRITRYADQLWNGLDELKHWDDVVQIQRNWIGDCDVYKFHLPLISEDSSFIDEELNLCLNNPLDLLATKSVRVKSTNILCSLSERRKESEALSVCALNPLTKKPLPIFVSDSWNYQEHTDVSLELHDSGGAPTISESDLLGLALNEGWGGYRGSRKLDDWVVSRQRYWGTPIPIVHCEKCKAVPVRTSSLPVILPKLRETCRGELRGSPLELAEEWKNTSCPKCGGKGVRETDTLDTFFDSTWYFLRYLDPQNPDKIFDGALANSWMPVDIYVGGKEHAALHLFFARFITHFLHNSGMLRCAEPFDRLLPQGIVRGKTYQVPSTGTFVPKEKVHKGDSFEPLFPDGEKWYHSDTGDALEESWQKMSKSRHNGVNPLDMLERFGIDMTRLVTVSGVSPQSDRDWDPESYVGIQNWLNRVLWVMGTYAESRCLTGADSAKDDSLEGSLRENYNYFVRLVTYHIEKTFLFNVAISRMQGLTNTLRKCPLGSVGRSMEFERCVHALLIMLSVFAPHLCAELWQSLSTVPTLRPELWEKSKPVWEQKWPELDFDAEFDLIVTGNDILLDTIRMDRRVLEKLNESEAVSLILSSRNDRKNRRKFDKRSEGFWNLVADRNSFDSHFEHIDNFGATLCLTLKS